MKKVYDINEWHFTDRSSKAKRVANVNIYLKYTSLKEVEHLTPKERVQAIDKDSKKNFSKLLELGLLDRYKLIGSKKRPRGVETDILFKDIESLAKKDFIESIFINSIEGGKKVKKKEPLKFFCVKITIVAHVENITKGMQTVEEQYILIKAKTFEDAYERVERQKKKYELSYLNRNGQIVQWKLESMDDCFETFILDPKELNNKEGVEVYSTMKNRRVKH